MVAKEFINDYEPVVVLPEDINGFQGNFDDHRDDHEEEEEETLSLCDLAVSSNAEDYYWNELSHKEDHDDEDEDFFEFSSEDFTASSSYPKPNQNIIFCGKIIPYRGEDQVVDHDHDHQTQNQNNSTNDLKLQNTKKSLNTFPQKSKKEKHGNDFKFDFSMKKVSTMPTSTTTLKSRWYLLAFGSFGKGSGLSTRMELRDIKSRQSRQSKVAAPTATMFRFDVGGGSGDKLATTRGDEKRSGSKGLWRLLKILGCKSQRANAVVKAPFCGVSFV